MEAPLTPAGMAFFSRYPVLKPLLDDLRHKTKFGGEVQVSEELWLHACSGPSRRKVRFQDLLHHSQEVEDPLASEKEIGSEVPSHQSVDQREIAEVLKLWLLDASFEPQTQCWRFRSTKPVRLVREIAEQLHLLHREGLNPCRLYIGRRAWDHLRAEVMSDFAIREDARFSGPPEYQGMKVVFTLEPDYYQVEGGRVVPLITT